MVALRTVKDTLVLPLIFFRNLSVLFFLFLAGYIAVSWGTAVSPEKTALLSFLPAFLHSGIHAVFPFSVVLALLFSLTRFRRHPGLAPLSIMILLLTAAAVFIFEPFVLSEYGTGLSSKVNEVFPVDESHIGNYGGSGVYVERQNGQVLTNILRIVKGHEPVLDFVPSSSAGGNVLSPESGWDLLAENDLPPFAAVFSPPSYIAQVFDEIEVMNRVFSELYDTSLSMFALTSLSVLFCLFMGALFLSRSRWPLFNAVAILIFLRVFLYVFPILWGKGILQIAGLFVKEKYLPFVPSGLLLAAGILFLLSALLSMLSGKNRNGGMYG